MTQQNPRGAYLFFAAFFIVAAFTILQSFVFGLLWGTVMAVCVWPLYERSSGVTGLRRWSPGGRATLFTAAFALLFLGPMAYGIYELAGAYSAGASYLTANTAHGAVPAPAVLSHLPFSAKLLEVWNDNVAPSTGVVDLLNRVSQGRLLALLPSLWGQVMDKLLTATVMLVSLYFMLKNGQAVKNQYAGVLRHWTGERSVSYVQSVIEALRGTINGVVLVGAVEGVLLALPLMMGGVRAGLLIGLAAGFLGVIPMLMPLLVLPCLGYMYLAGQTTWAIVGAIDLALVWFVCENIVKPAVINQRVRINTWLILMAMVGGLQLLGLFGLFLGPAVIAVALGMLQDLVTPAKQVAAAPPRAPADEPA